MLSDPAFKAIRVACVKAPVGTAKNADPKTHQVSISRPSIVLLDPTRSLVVVRRLLSYDKAPFAAAMTASDSELSTAESRFQQCQ